MKHLSPLRFCPLLSWKLKRSKSKTPISYKFELYDFLILCCHKSFIIDDVRVRDPSLVCLFPLQNITKNIRI